MGIALRKLLHARVVVVFGATSRIGMATVDALTCASEAARCYKPSIAVVAAVENATDARARRLKRLANCYLVRCKFSDVRSIRRAVRNADAVLLVPALSASGAQLSKRVIDAMRAESVTRLVIVSSILATPDFWSSESVSTPALPAPAPVPVPTHAPAARRGVDRTDSGENGGRVGNGGNDPADPADLGFDALEAHARSVLPNCVSLRIPLLMETILYCRDAIMYGNRFYGCFDPSTVVPTIAVKDVAAAASRVLTEPTCAFEATYCLASAAAAVTMVDVEQQLSQALGKQVKYRRVSDDQLVALMRESGATQYVAQSIVRLKLHLEASTNTTSQTDDASGSTAATPTNNVASRHVSDDATGSAATVTLMSESTDDDSNEDARMRQQIQQHRQQRQQQQLMQQQSQPQQQLARFGFTNDVAQLVGRPPVTPAAWLSYNAKHFVRSPENEMQLFVVGASDGFFAELERFVAWQVTSATAAPANAVGEAAIPVTATAGGSGATQAKVTFCAIKPMPVPPPQPQSAAPPRWTAPSQRRAQPQQSTLPRSDSHYGQLPGGIVSPLDHLLTQLSALDVIVYIPPLHLSASERHAVTRVVVDAAAKANVWGIVVVSALFADDSHATAAASSNSAHLNDLRDLETFIERSGVPHVIVRLPMFMEYFLALSSVDLVRGDEEVASDPHESQSQQSMAQQPQQSLQQQSLDQSQSESQSREPTSAAATTATAQDTEEKPRVPATHGSSSDVAPQQQQQPSVSHESAISSTAGTSTTLTQTQAIRWHLLDRSLATSRVYLIAMADAAKALVAIAFTFPLHRGRTRTLYTECLTMDAIEATLQQFAYKRRRIAFAHVDALHETPGREFWKVAHWPRALTKEMLECSIALPAPIPMTMTFDDVTECESITFARWARANAKQYTHALAVGAD